MRDGADEAVELVLVELPDGEATGGDEGEEALAQPVAELALRLADGAPEVVVQLHRQVAMRLAGRSLATSTLRRRTMPMSMTAARASA